VRFHHTRFGPQAREAITVAVRRYEVAVPFGVLSMDGGTVTAIQEKPVVSHFVSAGVYVVGSGVIGHLDGGRHDMPDIIAREIARSGSVAGFPITEPWMDIGTPEQFAIAQNMNPRGYSHD
jgi:NDP-sugar pyrophosphorylase family protein